MGEVHSSASNAERGCSTKQAVSHRRRGAICPPQDLREPEPGSTRVIFILGGKIE